MEELEGKEPKEEIARSYSQATFFEEPWPRIEDAGGQGKIYFLETADRKFIKIGYSKDIDRRFSQLGTLRPRKNEEVLAGLIPDNPIMAGAWVGSMEFAFGNEEIMAQFEADTGLAWRPGRSPIERMIDDACGLKAEFVAAFARWHNANIWGEENGDVIDAPGWKEEAKP